MAGCRPTEVQKLEGDDVEKSLEVLDKVLSEFEDPESLPHIHIEPESPSQGNQSEDDGYMSMNGRRTSPSTATTLTNNSYKIASTNNDSINNAKNLQLRTIGADNNCDSVGSGRGGGGNPIASSAADRSRLFGKQFIGNGGGSSGGGSGSVDIHQATPDTENRNGSIEEVNLSQTTLPKIRPSIGIPSKYSSLPCAGPARSSFAASRNTKCVNGGSFDGDRNRLGMGISAVHDAVLRGGVAKLPEPIVNEHPVTIYPGRASPTKGRLPPRTLPGSMEKHREVCRNGNANEDATSASVGDGIDTAVLLQQTTISPLKRLIITKSPSSPLVAIQQHVMLHNSVSSNQLIDNKNLQNCLQITAFKPTAAMMMMATQCSSESEDFSDDSLEGQSLPPPPPPPIVPPSPSLSAPVTPSKRGSIAWEINLDDHLPPPPPSSANSNSPAGVCRENKTKNGGGKEKGKSPSSASAKIITRRRGRSVSGSQSSLASTPGSGSGSNHESAMRQHYTEKNRSKSMEWPEPPEQIVCSTEDEAASIYSDSDELIQSYPINMVGKGTYVIRKGRKERQRLSDINTSMSSSINSRLSNEGSLMSGHSASLFIPSSRHSIDLGASTRTSPIIPVNAMLSPRSRLSLDLGSPNATSEIPLHNAAGSAHSNDFKLYMGSSSSSFDGRSPMRNHHQQHHHHHHDQSNGNGTNGNGQPLHGSSVSLNNNSGSNMNNYNGSNGLSSSNPTLNNSSLTRIGGMPNSQPTQQSSQNDVTTPRRELAPPLEEDEEQDSESQSREAPLRQIENNISALLRGDIAVARVGDIGHPRRPLGFRPGVHKSESAKEMLLSQNAFGPLPPSPPPSSSPEPEIDAFPPLPLPPLPPSPPSAAGEDDDDGDVVNVDDVVRGMPGIRITSRTRLKNDLLYSREELPPIVPPHRSQPSSNTLKTRSMDGYSKKYSTTSSHGSIPGTLPGEMPSNGSRSRHTAGAYTKRSSQSPREESRLQTSCSLPETPIFARGSCDIARTPHRRVPEVPSSMVGSGSRTAPRSSTNANNTLTSSIVGVGSGSTLGGGRQRSISQALAGGEMLRLAGGPARGWYPKQRTMRPASTEHLDRLHRSQGSMRAWDGTAGMSGTGVNRKPLTLPPNLTPKFFNKSPREALRRVTSLLIKKGNGKEKENKREKDVFVTSSIHRSAGSAGEIPITNSHAANNNNNTTTNHTSQKKKGFFKNFWKKSKHYSLDQ